MKKMLYLLLFATGCSRHSHHANDLIAKHVREIANDPSSYEPVSFGKPESTGQEDEARITHSYRAKNGFGALVLSSSVFEVDSVADYVHMIEEPIPNP